MTRTFVIAVVLVAACAGLAPAHAAPPPQPARFDVGGRIASKCSLGTSPAPLTINTTVANNGKLDPALNGKSFILANVMCDAPSKISLTASALRIVAPRTSLPTGQSQTANFTATATGWSSNAARVTTAQTNPVGSTATYTGTAQSQNAAKVGTVTVTVSNFTTVVGTNGNGWKLIDGSYSATITLSLTPSS